MEPKNLSRKQRQEFKNYCNNLDIEITALCGDLGGHGFQVESENKNKIYHSTLIVELAKDIAIGKSIETNDRVQLPIRV